MTIHTLEKSAAADRASNASAAGLNDTLAEAARFAVFSRVMPVLRHDVAGVMQPQRTLLMVVHKRLQADKPDIPAILENIASLNILAKQASSSCMAALGWISAGQEVRVSLQSGVNEVSQLLAVELASHELTLVNAINSDAATVPQNFLRTVLVGALLAFCDQQTDSATLNVSLTSADAHSSFVQQLHFQLQPRPIAPDGNKSVELLGDARQHRLINWLDVEALAHAHCVQLLRGDGWLTMGLPE
jgi:hypothetical protein